MNLTIELPEDVLLISKADLRKVFLEMVAEYHVQMANDEIMTIKETATYLKVSVPTVRALISNKEIPYFQKGQVIRLNRSQVSGWLRENSR
ncbi:helix-turn-helix domain-containing protein [Neobacillus niacini]|uniref:helix-turn-helix domain-containing protein n=1 Tax=Neobacillus niacini TaxID=86668 RepID=UPI003B01EA99